MKYLFIIQGEGRGHMTQAISLRNKLINAGHEVPAVVVGKSIRRTIPEFFYDKIKCKVQTVDSPNFVVDKNNKKIRIGKSILYNIFHLKRFLKSIREIKELVCAEKPDAIINFYDLVGGLYYLLHNPRIPYYCIGHQYLMYHPEFPFPKGHYIDRFLLKVNTKITSFRADKFLALSFSQLENIPEKKLYVVPPLLRKSVLDLKPRNEGYIHGYMLNQGYANDIIEWHKQNPDEEAHFFWDKNDAEDTTVIHRNLAFHKINDVKFLEYMNACKGYASTAGFESICEAMYLGKPVLMIPTSGHYEQKCNALDGVKNGAGIASDSFDLSKLLEYLPKHNPDNSKFRRWVESSNERILTELENCAEECAIEETLCLNCISN